MDAFEEGRARDDPSSFYHASFVAMRDAVAEFVAGGARRVVIFVDDATSVVQRASRMRVAAREDAFAAPEMRLMDERDWDGTAHPKRVMNHARSSGKLGGSEGSRSRGGAVCG